MNMKSSAEEDRIRYSQMKKGEIILETNNLRAGYCLKMALYYWDINFKIDIKTDNGLPSGELRMVLYKD